VYKRQGNSPLRGQHYNNEYEENVPYGQPAPQLNNASTKELRFHLTDLNKKMDEVENRCHDLTSAARRKTLLEESMRNANYMNCIAHDPSRKLMPTRSS
jgi:hypothetical protein